MKIGKFNAVWRHTSPSMLTINGKQHQLVNVHDGIRTVVPLANGYTECSLWTENESQELVTCRAVCTANDVFNRFKGVYVSFRKVMASLELLFNLSKQEKETMWNDFFKACPNSDPRNHRFHV